MYMKITRLSKKTIEAGIPAILIAISYFVVLINPFGWHMIIHVAPIYIIFALAVISSKKHNSHTYRREYFLFTFFVIYVLISFVVISHFEGSGGKLLRHLFELFIFIIFSRYLFTESDVQFMMSAYIFSAYAIIIKMLIQRIGWPTDPNRYTINNMDTLMDPNYLASVLLAALIINFYKCEKNSFKGKYLIKALVPALGILATGSRGAFVAGILGCAILYVSNRNIKSFIITSVVIIAGFFFFIQILPASIIERFSVSNYQDASNELRFNLWTAAWNIFVSSPLFGRGGNAMMELGVSYGARINILTHNSFLDILADYGIIGFFFSMCPLVMIGVKAVIRKNTLVIALMAATFTCAFFVSAFDSAFFWQNILLSMALLRFDNNIHRKI